MSFDIYGNYLIPGHCEVHPEIAEPYPCSQCYFESQQELAMREPEPPQRPLTDAELKEWSDQFPVEPSEGGKGADDDRAET